MRNSDLNVVEGVDDNFGGLVFQGSADDELFVSEAGDDTTINARGGDDTIELAASDDVDRSTDLINTGGGSDTIILNENNTAIVRSDGFDVENDVFDVSNLEGVDSFDDINFDVIDNEESNNNGEFFFFEAGTASITVDEELQGDLTEDNFIFADDDDAVAEAEDDSAEDEEEVAEEEDAADEEVAEDDSDTDDDGDLVEVEGNVNRFGDQVFQGSAADELFVSEAGDDTTINARGGDDTIELEGSDDVDRSTDLIDTGGGSDTIILNENNTAIVRSDGFDVDNDVFDVSNLEGVNNFDDINFDVIDNEESNNNGEFFFFEAGTASITIDEELQDDLSEDNFIFADDAVA